VSAERLASTSDASEAARLKKRLRVTHNTPFRAGKGYLYEGGLRVPLIVRGPGIVKGRVLETPFLKYGLDADAARPRRG
jgi:arylsulfatase A-like enzyme